MRLESRRSDLPSSGHRQMANTLHLTMRDAIVALVLPFLTPARAACSTRAPRSSSTVSAAAPPALDFLLLDHVKVAAAAADTHSRRTELDNPAAVTMNTCRCRRVEPAALPVFALSIAAAKKRRCSRTAAKHITPSGVGFRPCERKHVESGLVCPFVDLCACLRSVCDRYVSDKRSCCCSSQNKRDRHLNMKLGLSRRFSHKVPLPGDLNAHAPSAGGPSGGSPGRPRGRPVTINGSPGPPARAEGAPRSHFGAILPI